MSRLDINGLVGIPYAGEKFCRTFAAQVMARIGIVVPPVMHPGRARHFERVDAPQEGDLVVLTEGGRPRHVGVCLGGGRFVHVEEGERSRVERLTSPLWANRIEGYYRYTGGVQ